MTFFCHYCEATEKHDRRVCRLKALHADPEFKAKMEALHADPEFNPLAALPASDRADYDVLKKAGYTRAEALRAVCRADLIDESAEFLRHRGRK